MVDASTALDLARRFRYKPGWTFDEFIIWRDNLSGGQSYLMAHAAFSAPDSGLCVEGKYPKIITVHTELNVPIKPDDNQIMFAKSLLNKVIDREIHETREFGCWVRDGLLVAPFHPHTLRGICNWNFPHLAPSGLRL